jgi:hypothetical protein
LIKRYIKIQIHNVTDGYVFKYICSSQVMRRDQSEFDLVFSGAEQSERGGWPLLNTGRSAQVQFRNIERLSLVYTEGRTRYLSPSRSGFSTPQDKTISYSG